MGKIKKIEINVVYWQDAYVTTDDKPDLERGTSLTLSIGKIVREDKDFLYMSHFYDGIGGAWENPWTVIPKGMVRSNKVVKV